MKRLLSFCAVAALAFTVAGCASDESALRDSSSLLLSAKEVRDIISGNTVTSADGKTFYFDRSGLVTGKGAYGEKSRGNWNITPEGQLCFSNWNANYAPSACYKAYFDNVSQQRKLVDANGDVKYTVINILTGNPNNF